VWVICNDDLEESGHLTTGGVCKESAVVREAVADSQ
jgi:hypothetical protein